MKRVGYNRHEATYMATTSFDKRIVIKDDKAADVLIKVAQSVSPQPATRTSSYRLVSKETLVKKSVAR